MKQDPLRQFSGVGFGGAPMAQWWSDLFLWEVVLNGSPQVKGIVELGTWQGGFSWFLWAQAQARGLEFRTYDVVTPDAPPPNFERIDIYRHAKELGETFAAMGPVVLFCDGGNKPRELRTFPPYLAEGSVVLAHDWGTETTAGDVPDFLEEHLGDYCDELGSISRVFTIKGKP